MFRNRLCCFQLPNRAISKRRIAAEVMGVEDCADAAQRMAGDRRDLSFGTSGNSEPCYCCAAQIVERDTDNTDFLTSLRP